MLNKCWTLAFWRHDKGKPVVLQYDATLDQYTYVWKTDKAWAGTCRQLVVKLDDGGYHRANFKFVK